MKVLKIGAFCQHNNTSVDAIRHYMELGLLVPEKSGGHYVFDDTCQREYDLVMEFKGMGFALSEILNLFHFMRLGVLTPYEKASIYQSFFKNRSKQIETQIEALQKKKLEVDGQIGRFIEADSQVVTTNEDMPYKGIPLKDLALFTCPSCDGILELREGKVQNNGIVDGILECACGRSLVIEDGILISLRKDAENGISSIEDLADYIKATAPEYLSKLNESLAWTRRRVSGMDIEGKTILELGTGAGFFLRNISDLLNGSVYLAVDRDRKRLEFVKALLDRTCLKGTVIFVCADFRELPIAKGVVDIVVDMSGTSNFAFESEAFLPGIIDKHVRPDAELLGAYITFDVFAMDSPISSELRHNFRLGGIKGALGDLRFDIIEESLSEYVERGGPYEDYFKAGERVRTYTCHALRRND